jgi:hypothetical protein
MLLRCLHCECTPAELYHRGGGGRADDSCAFEHVFVGEIGQTKDRTGKEVKGSE